MKTKILVLSIALVLSANLRAQVTIGSANAPKAGAILDLNSGAKGGLVLSNVGINHPIEIPAGFPGVTPENTDAAKVGLKGALVYNTNENICIGIHAWNGDYWERIVANFIVAQGTPLTSSNAALAFGGDVVNFTASLPGAKTYRWYSSKNNGDYEYQAITTTDTWSKDFPPGKWKVKVIMDDCHSLTESNELAFTPASISPNFGSTAGGNTVYIYGDFPYAATSDYVAQSDLVAHYDGINNRGLGDKSHDYSATSWKDLKSGFELPRGTAVGQWLSNGFQSLNETIVPLSNGQYPLQPSLFYTNTVPGAYPVGGAARTVEVIFRTPDAANMFVQANQVARIIFLYGTLEVAKPFAILYRGLKEDYYHANNDICGTGNPWIFYPIAGNTHNLISCLSSTPSLETPATINTVTSTYQNNMNDPLTNSFINNTPATILERIGALNTGTKHFTIGVNLPYATILSMRLYNRVLTSEEIAQNALLDQARYLTPPTVTIDGVPCTEVIVLSPHFLMCKVPPTSPTNTGNKDVVITTSSSTLTLDSAYKYVDAATDFYVSNISRIIGSAGDPLTLTGNLFEHIHEVKVGNVVCTTTIEATGTDGTDTCKFNLPAGLTGEVDITITMDNPEATTYRFAKIFEYR